MSNIHVMSGGAPKEVFLKLTPEFERKTGHKVTYTFAVHSVLREKLAAGERPDVLVLPVPVLDGMVKDGIARADARGTFGFVGTSVVVKSGAPRPDVSTREKFRDALVAARSVVHSPPGKTPSGTHMGKVVEQFGIADAMAGKTVHKPALEGGLQVVLGGQAEFGIYPTSEVSNVEGLTIVGPLPPGLEFGSLYGGAATAKSEAADAAKAFVVFMASPANRETWTWGGFDPPPN